MKITYYVASSMNGFIAEGNQNVDFLNKYNELGIDFNYKEFFDSVDGIIMGNNTYKFIAYWGNWPYENIPTWVCSQHSKVEKKEGANIQPQVGMEEAVKNAKESGVKHLWVVGGGKLAAEMINKGFITNITVTQMPIALKGKIPLFSGLRENVSLRLDTCKTFKEGIVELHYTVEQTTK